MVAAVLLPFVAMLIWRRGKPSKKRTFFFISAILLQGAVCAAIIAMLLVQFGALELEWRGGYVPVLTWAKTKTDLAALARSRATPAKPTGARAVAPGAGARWAGFRGPHGTGEYTETPILTNWPAGGLKLLWRQPCGGGYSSFAMVDGRAFTLEQRSECEVIVAYDIETGGELWTNGWPARFAEYHSDEGPRSTPTYDDGKIYALGAAGEFRCVDAGCGKVIWAKNIAAENNAELPDYGLTASPLIVDEKIILQPDAYKGRSVVCYDKRDGRQLWHALDMPMGYATPMLMTNDGERQVVVCGRPFTVGLRLSDGEEQWRYNWHINNNERPITQPVAIGGNRLMLSAAYMTGCAAFEVTKTNDAFATRELWRNKSLKSKFASSVLFENHVYGFDEDILACIDTRTGERMWKDGRYGYGQVLLANGHLVIQCANGDLALVKAAPDKWTELARFPALHGKTWNIPAIGAGRLLVRNCAEMACYEISVVN